ncbi:DMBT1 protein, partial [Amia calva]|nr:DMBT1 protein [Amia calva]
CSGRVELQFGDQWGTLCDSDWDLQDASVVCRQLQCGEAVDTPGGAHYGEGRGPVWDEQLDCRGNESTVFECPVSTKKGPNCTHRNDASVICSGQGGPRLVGGESRCSGRVEVLRGALWGSVCDRHLDLQTADVICRHLQCGGAAATPRGAPYGAGSGPLWKDRFHCSGSEGRLGDCPLSWDQEDCDQGSVANVVCSEHWRLRLAGGGSQCAGRVEVYHGGAWGSVCDDLWDLADASVVCRQLGCGQALRATGSAEFGGGSGPIWLDDVSCRGNETALWDCPRASWERRNCRHKEDAGVVCSEHKELRLVSAEHHCAGRLDVLYNGTWGSVCSNGMKPFTIASVCQQLQCGDSGSLQDGEQYETGSGPKWLDRVDCQGHESVLWQCPAAPWGHNDCQDSEVAHIQCARPRLRLVGPEGRCSGRVEVCLRGVWGTVCDDSWDLQDARVVCRELGCGSAISAPQEAHWGEGNGTLWLDEVSCRGTERALLECRSSPPGSHDCTHKEDAAVLCAGQGGPRLVGGESRCSGRVEVLRGALWGSVCDRHLDLQTADVICRHLQCGGAAATPRGAPYGAGSGPLWKDRFHCSGSEGRLGDCPLSWDQEDCDQGSVANVVCSDADWQVRLRGTDSRCEGRLEVLWNGSWGRVLDSQWDLQDASAVCTNLHCGRALLASNSTEYGHGDGPVVLTAVECTGQEPALQNCTLTLSSGPGSTSGGVGVRCSEHWRLRLAGGGSQCAGRVEVYHGGAWGSVCDDLWDLADASVVCRQLGCGQALRATGSAEFGGGSGPVWLDDVSCRGNETALWDCPRASWERRNCRHKEDAGVVCSGPRLRLVGPEGRCSGRVEVCLMGVWGTVCDDSWDLQDARVVCRELGCGSAISAPQEAHWGEGNGTLWLDEVSCRGTERALLECRSSPPGSHDCTHKEDAAVLC